MKTKTDTNKPVARKRVYKKTVEKKEQPQRMPVYTAKIYAQQMRMQYLPEPQNIIYM